MTKDIWSYSESEDDDDSEAWVVQEPESEEKPKQKRKGLEKPGPPAKLARLSQVSLPDEFAEEDDDDVKIVPPPSRQTSTGVPLAPAGLQPPQHQQQTRDAASKPANLSLLSAEARAVLNDDLFGEDNPAGSDNDEPGTHNTFMPLAALRKTAIIHTQQAVDPTPTLVDDDDDVEVLWEPSTLGQQQQQPNPGGGMATAAAAGSGADTEAGGGGPKVVLVCKWGQEKDQQLLLRIGVEDKLSKLMDAFKQHSKVKDLLAAAGGRVKFKFDGENFDPHSSPGELEMDDHDIVDVYIGAK